MYYVCVMDNKIAKRNGYRHHGKTTRLTSLADDRMYAVDGEVFCEKGGMSRDFMERAIERGLLKCAFLRQAGASHKRLYIMIDWQALRILGYCGNKIRERWADVDGREVKDALTIDGLAKFGLRIATADVKGGRFISVDELCAFTNKSKDSIMHSIKCGVLTGRFRARVDKGKVGWQKRRRMFILADEYLEMWFENIGAICTGMTYVDCLNVITAMGAAMRQARNALIRKHVREIVNKRRKKRIVPKEKLVKAKEKSIRIAYDYGIKKLLSKYGEGIVEKF